MTAYVSAFDLFSVGIGPSSSHTVGPMRAAADFVERLEAGGLLEAADRIGITLYGSLGSTGLGHGTPDAVLAGLAGLRPETCDPTTVHGRYAELADGEALPDAEESTLLLGGRRRVPIAADDLQFEPWTRLPVHPNALTIAAWDDADPLPLAEETYYSIGGGFITRDGDDPAPPQTSRVPYPFATGAHLLALCDRTGLSIDRIAAANEAALRDPAEIDRGLDALWAAMDACISAGLEHRGILPGGLGVKRRAAAVRDRLEAPDPSDVRDTSIEWLHAFALAVNEENAAGGRVVTAPTNGAAGILPAVGRYYLRQVPGADADGLRRYLLTATAIGSLVKANASISGAEAGCQGEVGTACSMAAAGLCAVLGGTPHQVENAAEIAMEHHLGLTCDPVGGLVQVPCIERNAIAASTAVSAARLALHGDGTHLVPFDTVIETMRQTGADMSMKYKETSEGGLAVNVPDC